MKVEREPFPHVVHDGWLRAAASLCVEAESIGEREWQRGDHGGQFGKLWIDDLASLDRLARYARLVLEAIVASGASAEWEVGGFLREIGVLEAWADIQGGGLHRTIPGGWLGMHRDFNRHPDPTGPLVAKPWRRANALLYLTDAPENGAGWLHLRHAKTGQEARIRPLAGRLVVLATGRDWLHGHPTPWEGPGDRLSLAVYFYGATPAPGEEGAFHWSEWPESAPAD